MRKPICIANISMPAGAPMRAMRTRMRRSGRRSRTPTAMRSPPRASSTTPISAPVVKALAVASAEPRTPSAGAAERAEDEHVVQHDVDRVHDQADRERRTRVARRTQRRADDEQHRPARDRQHDDARERDALVDDRGLDAEEPHDAGSPHEDGHDRDEREAERCDDRLPGHATGHPDLAGADVAGDQRRGAGTDRHRDDRHAAEDLRADADRRDRVAAEPAHHEHIDEPDRRLGEEVHDDRPGERPHRSTELRARVDVGIAGGRRSG